jgi:hypothetical protein
MQPGWWLGFVLTQDRSGALSQTLLVREQTLLSGLRPKLTCIGAKLVETWWHAHLSFGRDGYQE